MTPTHRRVTAYLIAETVTIFTLFAFFAVQLARADLGGWFYYHLLWYPGVFAGGYFLHSLVSILIFLFLPTAQARKISPAFAGWNGQDRLQAWAQYGLCWAFHAFVWLTLGTEVWRYALLYPLLAFAWIWSLLVYIFRYHTTIGAGTRYNVRALRRQPFMSWLLLNFNEHATHHMKPTIPWYELPAKRQALPEPYARNQDAQNFWQAIARQFRGPTIVYDRDENPTPHLFVRWEDQRVRVRAAVAADAPALLGVKRALQLSGVTPPGRGGFLLGTPLEHYRAFIARDRVLIAEEAGRVVGFAVVLGFDAFRSSELWTKQDAVRFTVSPAALGVRPAYFEQLAFLPG